MNPRIGEAENTRKNLSVITNLKPSKSNRTIGLEKSPKLASFKNNVEHRFWEVPITPESSLFSYPSESPEYTQLNERLKDLYKKFDNEIDNPLVKLAPLKNISVKNTSNSSLMLRRNSCKAILKVNSLY